MARREDYLLSRLLLTDGTVSFEDLSNILLKWTEESPKSLLQAIIAEKLISEEEGRGLMMCLNKLNEQEEPLSSLSQLDTLLCQMIIKKNLATPELVNEYQRKITAKGGGEAISECLLRDSHITSESFLELKRVAERLYYRRRILALARGKERLSGIFRSPGRDEPGEETQAKARTGIQKIISDVQNESKKKPTLKKRRGKALPKIFGNYEVLEEIASGGMGTVYKVRHTELDRILALKVLHEEEESPEKIKRFLREADAAGRLKHPNIVGIYEVGIIEDRHFFSMDYIDGVPLSVLIKEAKNLELEDLLNIAIELGRAVDYAHSHGIIHRDLKPANIIIDLKGHPQITDFGLAKVLDTQTRLTRSDTIIGTPFYMAPEQTRGENDRINVTTDIWALGVMLYEITTKKLPFTGRSSIELYHKINHADPTPPKKVIPSLPKEIDYIILKAMSKEMEDRYKSASDMANDIERYIDGKPIAMQRIPPWLKHILRWLKSNKWLLLVALAAILLGWLCGWVLLTYMK